jgi:hypothetical protein
VLLAIAVPLVTKLLSSMSRFRNESELLVLTLLGGTVYGVLVLALFGRRWAALLRRGSKTEPGAASAPPNGAV